VCATHLEDIVNGDVDGVWQVAVELRPERLFECCCAVFVSDLPFVERCAYSEDLHGCTQIFGLKPCAVE
jgi:hypothetical protein